MDGTSTEMATIELPPDITSSSDGHAKGGSKLKESTTTKELVTFKGPQRRKGIIQSEAPKCSLESITSKCSASSDSSHHLYPERPQSAMEPNLSQSPSPPAVAPADDEDLGWRPRRLTNINNYHYNHDYNLEEQKQPPPRNQDTYPYGGQPDKSPLGPVWRHRRWSDSSADDFGHNEKMAPSRLDDDGNGKEAMDDSPPKPPFMFAGIVASIVSSLFFSTSILCVRLTHDNSVEGNARTLAIRGLIISLCSGLTILCQGSSFRVGRDELWVNVLRALFGTFAIYGAYCAMNYISIGDTTALVFSSPIWTSLLSRLILKEPLQWAQLVALPASLLGIVLIAHPALIVDVDHLAIAHPRHPSAGDNSSEPLIVMELAEYQHRWPGILIALLTSFCVSGVYIVLKFRKNTPIQTCTFWLGATMTSSSLAILTVMNHWSAPGGLYEWSLLLLNGVFSWLGQCILQWAFYYESASILSVVRTLDVALTFVLSTLFLDDEIYWTSIVGATIIGLVVASIMLNNWLHGCLCGASDAAADAASAVTTETDQCHSGHPEKARELGEPYVISGQIESSYRVNVNS